MLACAVAALIALNLVTVMAYRADKHRAVAGQRRISERDLLSLAALGGTPGAIYACRRFRHKTRKQPFATLLLLIAAIQAGIALQFLF